MGESVVPHGMEIDWTGSPPPLDDEHWAESAVLEGIIEVFSAVGALIGEFCKAFCWGAGGTVGVILALRLTGAVG